jgi:ribonuclease HI
MNLIHLYADGSSLGNPGPSAFCSILIDPNTNSQKIITGSKKKATNNEMELLAVIQGLNTIQDPHHVVIYTDSAFVQRAFRYRWFERWQQNEWKNSKHKPVKYQDLWQKLIHHSSFHILEFIKVKGHSDNKIHNLCDQIARKKARKLKKKEKINQKPDLFIL